jgi:hypothetical protein
MPDPTELATGEAAEPKTRAPERASDNAAVNRCIRARQRAFAASFAEYNNREHANAESKRAFRRALPPLAGHENVCDFIACITYALANEVIFSDDAAPLLGAAKIALSALRHEPSQPGSEPKRLGRPPKSLPTEEIK